MKKLALGLLFALLACCTAQAQSTVRVNAQAVATCGGQSLTAGIFYPFTIDLTGTLCVASGAGGITAAVTVANGADVAEGNTADAAATAGGAGTVSAKLRLMTTQLGTINTTLGTPFQAGGVIGALPAGTAIIGKVGIDQTTPGTTNGVQVNAALPAGSNVIGHVIADTGSTTAVTQATAANLNATVVGTGTFAVQATTQGAVNITLTDCSSTIATGGTAQNAFTANAGRHGFTIANIDTTEVLWINFTGTAAASSAGSYPLGPADATIFTNLNSFTSPPGMGINTALSVVAATTAHKFTCTVW